MNLTERRNWLERRRQGIGSSDAAAIVGLSPYKSALEVWTEKVIGYDDQDMKNVEQKKWGLRLEEVIAEAYREETGRPAVKMSESIYQHKHRPWMIATPDRMATDGEGMGATPRLVELKTCSAFYDDDWGTPGTDEVPEGYLIQVQHQMEVLDVNVCDVAVLIGGSDFRVYTVNRNEKVIGDLVELERQFWQTVITRQQPEPDWGQGVALKLIERLNVPVDGVDIELSAEDSVTLEFYLDHREKEKEHGKLKDQAKAELIHRMGEAEVAFLPDGRRLSRKLVERAGYTVNPTSYYNFTVHNKRG